MYIKSDLLLADYNTPDFFRWLEFKKQIGWDKTIFVEIDSLPDDLRTVAIDYYIEASNSKVAEYEVVTYETTLKDERRLTVIFKNNRVRMYLNGSPHVSLLKTSDCKHVKS